MLLIHTEEFRLRDYLWPVLCVIVLIYFGYHALNGDRGVFALLRLSRELEVAETEHAALKAENDKTERKVLLLRPDSLDLDMADEKARMLLGYVGKDELVIERH
ncbi:MAG: septum formation initiator family protein [Alphaproteobacteria bacterium]|nr:septum formation initiator family protein [Alphaproteobacteria bacterium]